MNIVFVHFGEEIPNYLTRNLESACRRFEEHRVILLTNSTSKPINLEGLRVVTIPETADVREITELIDHPKDFRNGFWAHSINRLIVLADYVELTKQSLIHFESDVMISDDFPFDLFCESETDLAYPLVSRERGIASTVYIRNVTGARTLKQVAISEMRSDRKSTDMTILRKIYDLDNSNVTVLPTTADIKNSLSIETPQNIREAWKENLKKFNGVFDGADFGYFLLGTDPRNSRGVSYLRTTLNNHYVLTKEVEFIFNAERNFVDQEILDSKVPIFTLHATCKNSKLFSSKYKKLLKLRVEQYQQEPKPIFVFWAFNYNMKNALKRRITKFFSIISR